MAGGGLEWAGGSVGRLSYGEACELVAQVLEVVVVGELERLDASAHVHRIRHVEQEV